MRESFTVSLSTIKFLLPILLFSNCFENSIAQKNRIEFRSDIGAFTGLFQKEPTYSKNNLPNDMEVNGADYTIHIYQNSDFISRREEFVSILDLPLGYYQDPQIDINNELIVQLQQQGQIHSKIDTIFLQDYEGRQFVYEHSNGTEMNYMFFYRGNRLYRILSSRNFGNKVNPESDSFLRSFRFINFDKSNLENFVFEEKEFSIDLFQKPFIQNDTINIIDTELKDNFVYSSADPNSGGAYVLQVAEVNEYFRIHNVDSFLLNYAERLLSWNEKIIEHETIEIDSKKALEFVIEEGHQKSKSRHYLFLDESRIILFYSIVPKEQFESCYSEQIIHSFKSIRKKNPKDIFSSKATLIIDNLSSSDTSIYYKALASFNYYLWDESEREILLTALHKSHPSDTSLAGARYSLIDALSNYKDQNAINQLSLLYGAANTTELMREYILSSLTSFNVSDYLPDYANLFFTNPPKRESTEHWSLFSPLSDSLEYASRNLEQLLSVHKKGYYNLEILGLVGAIAKKYKNLAPLVEKHYSELFKNSLTDLEKYKVEFEEKEYGNAELIMNYLALLLAVKNEDFAKKYTPLIIVLQEEWLRTEALVVRIIYGLPNPKELVLEKVKNNYTRYDIIKAHYIAKRLHEIPDKYLKPNSFARTVMNEYVCTIDEEPDHLEHLGTFKEKGEMYHAIAIKYEWDKSTFLGICGPFNEDESFPKLEVVKAYTDWQILGDNWEKEARLLIPSLLDLGFVEYDPYW